MQQLLIHHSSQGLPGVLSTVWEGWALSSPSSSVCTDRTAAWWHMHRGDGSENTYIFIPVLRAPFFCRCPPCTCKNNNRYRSYACIKASPPTAGGALGSFAGSQIRQVKTVNLNPRFTVQIPWWDHLCLGGTGWDEKERLPGWQIGQCTPSQHPKGELSSTRKPQHHPKPPCAIFLAFPCTAVAVGLCTCKQSVLPQQLGQSTSLMGFLPALAQDLTIQVNLKFL